MLLNLVKYDLIRWNMYNKNISNSFLVGICSVSKLFQINIKSNYKTIYCRTILSKMN